MNRLGIVFLNRVLHYFSRAFGSSMGWLTTLVLAYLLGHAFGFWS